MKKLSLSVKRYLNKILKFNYMHIYVSLNSSEKRNNKLFVTMNENQIQFKKNIHDHTHLFFKFCFDMFPH